MARQRRHFTQEHKDEIVRMVLDGPRPIAHGDLDGACASANKAVTLLGGVASARSSSTLTTFSTKLLPYRKTPPARDFLDSIATEL